MKEEFEVLKPKSIEEIAEEKNIKIQPDHPLITRRDFLSSGLLAFGASLALPNIFGFSLRQAWAANCAAPVGTSSLPFLVFDMAGGAGLPANFLVGRSGGPEDLLASYNLLGWDPREAGSLNKDFGLPMSAKYSTMLAGIIANSSSEARAHLRMGSFCHFAQDDSTGNKLNAASLSIKAGTRGTFINNGMGLINSLSGGNSSPVIDSAVYKPNAVKSVNDVLGAVSFGGQALNGLSLDKKRKMVESSVELSRHQKLDYLDLPGGSTLADLSTCAYEKSLDFLTNVSGLDPRTDPNTQATYQINANSDVGDMNVVAAAISMNTLKGHSGPSTWTLGGCDYHDGTQTTGDRKDGEMGVQIGRAIELAYRLKKPLFFELITDGGVNAVSGTRRWQGDSGVKCMTVIGYFDPKKVPAQRRLQVGAYTNGQGADTSTLIGNDPRLVAYAVLANYLNIQGRLKDFAELAPGIFSQAEDLESVLIFETPT